MSVDDLSVDCSDPFTVEEEHGYELNSAATTETLTEGELNGTNTRYPARRYFWNEKVKRPDNLEVRLRIQAIYSFFCK